MNRSLATSVPRPARGRAAASTHLQQDSSWRPALVLGASSLLLLGLAYAVATTSVSRVLFPAQADGSLLLRDGQVRGSMLIAQPFVGDGYFQARPSAANYDPMAAAGSNMARSNPALQERVQASITAVAAREGVTPAQVPGDLVTQSGAGMDPELSPAAAQVQIARVARSRGLPVDQVAALVKAHTLGPQWGVFGQPRVNVMTLNLALDTQDGQPGGTRRDGEH
ncbi:potassium-transporting ATPase subunit KdpC [Stenotrophomonas sp. JAI102]|uniref:potassium-transporting ATPase subunit KdpC n=1 Tax=Stenotrophomonas sp. JAI102 TaxID=2723077 RepID=UPI0015C850A2|nr:potassium-transporting ATPase subunit KdpC [Stenotrophomonas sp. JAI102]NYF36876.1 K+-transporting ATPase ATPase C chain [Stenotrophomonas sp. JAI102]